MSVTKTFTKSYYGIKMTVVVKDPLVIAYTKYSIHGDSKSLKEYRNITRCSNKDNFDESTGIKIATKRVYRDILAHAIDVQRKNMRKLISTRDNVKKDINTIINSLGE